MAWSLRIFISVNMQQLIYDSQMSIHYLITIMKLINKHWMCLLLVSTMDNRRRSVDLPYGPIRLTGLYKKYLSTIACMAPIWLFIILYFRSNIPEIKIAIYWNRPLMSFIRNCVILWFCVTIRNLNIFFNSSVDWHIVSLFLNMYN